MALVTVAVAQTYGSLGSLNPTVLATLLEAASTFVEEYCQRKFESDTFTETYDGIEVTDSLFLNNYPIDSITSMDFIDVNGDSEAQDVADLEYDSENGEVQFRPFECWPSNWRSIQVVYTAGYATIPTMLQRGVCAVAAWMSANETLNPEMKSERIGDYNYTKADIMEIPAYIKSLLAPYVNWRRRV